jgi:hypothetical protein
LHRIPRFEATLMASLERDVLRNNAYYTCGTDSASSDGMADKQTAARWLGQDPDQIKLGGRVLWDALTGNGVLLKLNTYEARLLRQSQQLLGQLFALRKARAGEPILEETAENSDDEASGNSDIEPSCQDADDTKAA